MRQLAKLFGLECEIKGKEHLKSDEAYILVANHQSSIDCFGKPSNISQTSPRFV